MTTKAKALEKKTLGSRLAKIFSGALNFRYVKNMLHLFSLEYRKYRWHIIALGALSFCSGILEGFGVTAIIPIFAFVSKNAEPSSDLISQTIEKFFVFFHLTYTLKFLLIFIFGLFIIKSLVLFAANHIAAHITTSYENTTRAELLRTTLFSEWKHLSEQKIGYLSQVLTTDVSNSSALLTYISMFLITLTNLLIYTLLVVNVSSIVAVITVIFGLIIFSIFKPLLYKNKLLSQQVSLLYKESSHYVDEVMIGAKAVKSMRLEQPALNKGATFFEKVKTLTMRMVIIKNLTTALVQPLGMILILGIFAYFYKTGGFNFASFAVIVYAINKVFSNVEAVQIQLHKISSCVPYLGATVDYKKQAAVAIENDTGTGNFSFERSLDFKDVSFYYATGSDIISQVNFRIAKGEMVGIIGPSGAGKTTITDLILRLFKPTGGSIFIDGQTIDTIALDQWRTKIGYVSQDSFLINDTISNNIKFYNNDLSDVTVREAAKMANIFNVIEELPEKFNTLVGERGVKLSGGQRQRIILARVLATKPELLILDEATSALDNESEALIQATIDSLKGKITVIAIAHRLTTVMVADKLLVIENGKIVEQGSPEQLMQNNESYLSRVYHLR